MTGKGSSGPAPWKPNAQGEKGSRGGRVAKEGPTQVEVECKAALEQILRPSNFAVIQPWMQSASTGAKRDMVQLAKMASSGAGLSDIPSQQLLAAQRSGVVLNPQGRNRAANVIPMTADRAQADLLRNRSGSDVKDTAVEAKRQYFARYSSIPSTDSVANFHRLKIAPVHLEESTKVLNDQCRRNLLRWQTLGPENNPDASAEMMRSLRSIASAVERVPTYKEHFGTRTLGGEACRDSLFEFSRVAPKGSRTLKESFTRSQMHHSSSAPAILKPFLSQQDIDDVKRPGGYVVLLNDSEQLQLRKNKERAKFCKIASAGGLQDWSTTAGVMSSEIRALMV